MHVSKELKARNNVLCKKLLPNKGKAETLEGELLRAINRIVYRFFNDGDVFFEGYGKETCGPAVDFLSDKFLLNSTFKELENQDNETYSKAIINILENIINHIEKKEQLTKSNIDMYDYYNPDKHNDNDDYDDYNE